jgi:hypothetical protein
LWHHDIFRSALPEYILAVIVGFDEIWVSKGFRKAAVVLLPLFLAVAGRYCVGQIKTNAPPVLFMNALLEGN